MKKIRNLSSTNKISYVQYSCWKLFFHLIFIEGGLYKYLSNMQLYPLSSPPPFLSLKIKLWAIKSSFYIWCIQTSGVDSLMILITTLSVTWWQIDTWGLCPAFYFLAFYCYTTRKVIWLEWRLQCFICLWFRYDIQMWHIFFSRHSR